MTRVLVTGATGYIGSSLVKHLVAAGNYEVAVLTRPTSDLNALGGTSELAQVYSCTSEVDALSSVLEKAQPQVVVHLASFVLAQHKPAEVMPLIAANITFGTCLLEAMALTGITRILNTGTGWEAMDGPPKYRPACLYAATKRAFDDILTYYVDAHGFTSLTLRLYDTYGPADPRPKLFSLLERSLTTSEPLPFSAGEQVLDLVHVDDVVRAYERGIQFLLERNGSLQESAFIGSGQGRSLKEIVAAFEAAAGRRPNIALGARPYRPREVMYAQADLEPARRLLDWEPRIPLEEGMRKALSGTSTIE